MKIVAVVVTFNRLPLLKECLAAVTAQTHHINTILVINNSSTDGTTEWLNSQENITTITQPNEGGAGGFQTGLREAYKMNADWIWLMDDDTIPYPNSLEELVKATQKITPNDDEFGFFSSKVTWKDGEWHEMNKLSIYREFSGKQPAAYYVEKGIVPVLSATFVSMLVSRDAVKKAGLPLKEFFIWHDDTEYTRRIDTVGMKGGLVESSVVLHKTPSNYRDDIYKDSAKNIWKYRHGLRNQLYFRRHQKSYGSFVRNTFKRAVILPFKIMANRKEDRWPYIKVVWQSCWEALWFNPKKEYVEE